MSPTSIPENYSPIDSFCFQGVLRTTFPKQGYNPNNLNNTIHSSTIVKNQEKIIQNKEFRDVYNKIFQITKKYDLGQISVEEDIEESYVHIFVIQVPKEYDDYDKVLIIWDKIIDEIEEYCNIIGYAKYYKSIQIILK